MSHRRPDQPERHLSRFRRSGRRSVYRSTGPDALVFRDPPACGGMGPTVRTPRRRREQLTVGGGRPNQSRIRNSSQIPHLRDNLMSPLPPASEVRLCEGAPPPQVGDLCTFDGFRPSRRGSSSDRDRSPRNHRLQRLPPTDNGRRSAEAQCGRFYLRPLLLRRCSRSAARSRRGGSHDHMSSRRSSFE